MEMLDLRFCLSILCYFKIILCDRCVVIKTRKGILCFGSECTAKLLCCKPYKLQLVKGLKPNNKSKHRDFYTELEKDRYSERLMFSDEVMFQSEKVNLHNDRILGSENSHFTVKLVRDYSKVNIDVYSTSRCKILSLNSFFKSLNNLDFVDR